MMLSKYFHIGPVSVNFGWFHGEDPRLLSLEIMRRCDDFWSVFDLTIGKLAVTLSIDAKGRS